MEYPQGSFSAYSLHKVLSMNNIIFKYRIVKHKFWNNWHKDRNSVLNIVEKRKAIRRTVLIIISRFIKKIHVKCEFKYEKPVEEDIPRCGSGRGNTWK